MLRDDELQPQETSQISYKDYKKIVNSTKKHDLRLFLWVFFVLLLVFLGLAKTVSPDVDITLGDEQSEYSDENITRGEMDDRLKQIQMEDTYGEFQDESTDIEDGEKVVIPKKGDSDNVENKLPEEILGQEAVKDTVGGKPAEADKTVQKPAAVQTPAAPSSSSAPAPIVQTVTARVFVGNYPTAEQAEVARIILQDAGLGVSPFIRKIGNSYTLQAASYNSKEKAISAAQNLLNQNFPARVVVEYK